MVIRFFIFLQKLLDFTRVVDFLAPLLLRIYLFPIFWMGGTQKLMHMSNTIAWFGNTQWGLGLPFPTLLAYLATYTELIGAIFLLIGFCTRWMTIPLMVVMIVAAITVHIDNGWLVVASQKSDAAIRLKGFLVWLKNEFPGRHQYITQDGKPVILNNGIEFAATYFVMLLSLFFIGAGKFLSFDYWIRRYFMNAEQANGIESEDSY